MALCFTHSAAGYLAYELSRPAGPHRPRLLAAAVLLANAPDLDFVPGFLVGAPGVYHRGLSHTLLAALVVGLAVAALARLREGPTAAWRVGGWATAVYASHLLLDFVTADGDAPHGGRFLWPLSDAFYLAPVALLSEISADMSAPGAFALSLIGPGTLWPWVSDVSCLVVAVAGAHVARAVVTGGRRGEAADET